MTPRPGEDIEHYADKYEERQRVLRDLALEEKEREVKERAFEEKQERKERNRQNNPY